ncbi:MAG: hypothetical protein RL538_713 [Candidatus Parcubacteria bacterium]|jgi:prepilin-type N-terminal cleavage/methylation domain-containing protein
MKKVRGFTFVEVLVVVSVIAVLSTIVIAGMSEARKKSRDAERRSDLKLLQAAVERYKNDNGKYPEGCRPAGQWSGQIGTAYACPDGSNQYIKDLAPKYIPVLPNDDQLNGTDSGYVYVTNADDSNIPGNDERMAYKIEAKNTVESEIVDESNEFKSCDVSTSGEVPCSEGTQPRDTGNRAGMCDVAMCDRSLIGSSMRKPNHCSGSVFQKSYAVWGGFIGGVGQEPYMVARQTENIICEIQ